MSIHLAGMDLTRRWSATRPPWRMLLQCPWSSSISSPWRRKRARSTRLSFKGLCAHAVDRTGECLDEFACMLAILRVMLASSMFRAWSRWKSQARSTCSDSRAASTLSTAGGTTRKIGTCRGHRPLRRVQCGHEAFADRRAIGLFGALEANLSPLLAADGGCPPFRIP
jgi:hypothetical protein